MEALRTGNGSSRGGRVNAILVFRIQSTCPCGLRGSLLRPATGDYRYIPRARVVTQCVGLVRARTCCSRLPYLSAVSCTTPYIAVRQVARITTYENNVGVLSPQVELVLRLRSDEAVLVGACACVGVGVG